MTKELSAEDRAALAEELADQGDEIFCGTCGRPVRDGGGLYCSSRCEEIGNPGCE